MIVCGIDPGPTESAFVLWNGKTILDKGGLVNSLMLRFLLEPKGLIAMPDACAIEQIRGFGVMASDALFDTCCWTGRFLQAFGEDRTYWVPRKTAAAHVCGVGGISKDQFVREALISRFGGKDVAIGSKKQQGPLYGVAGHVWPALAVAITWMETQGSANLISDSARG